jgi:hypothetical protein
MILMKRDRQKKACSHVGFLSNIYQIYSKSKDRNTKEFKILKIDKTETGNAADN